MRHTGFPQVDGGQRDPWDLGRHSHHLDTTDGCGISVRCFGFCRGGAASIYLYLNDSDE